MYLVLTSIVQLHEGQFHGTQRVRRGMAVDTWYACQGHEGLAREVVRRQYIAVPHRQRQRRARATARLQRHGELEALIPNRVQSFLNTMCAISIPHEMTRF